MNLFDFEIVNLTPHAINIVNEADGLNITVEPSGVIARVASTVSKVGTGFYTTSYGEVEGLPEARKGTVYVVSGLVLSALGNTRNDVYAPATTLATRNEKGQIVSVPGLVK